MSGSEPFLLLLLPMAPIMKELLAPAARKRQDTRPPLRRARRGPSRPVPPRRPADRRDISRSPAYTRPAHTMDDDDEWTNGATSRHVRGRMMRNGVAPSWRMRGHGRGSELSASRRAGISRPHPPGGVEYHKKYKSPSSLPDPPTIRGRGRPTTLDESMYGFDCGSECEFPAQDNYLEETRADRSPSESG